MVKKIWIVLIGIIIFVALFIVIINPFAFFQPETKFLTQYGSGIKKCGSWGWMYGHEYPLSLSNEAIIIDYRIVTEFISDSQITELIGCKENTCNGNYKETDEYGCDIWKYSKTHKFDGCGDFVYQCVPYRISSETKTCSQMGGIGGSVECKHYDGCHQMAVYLTCTHTCGGANIKIISQAPGCYSEHKVYYKGSLVYETGTINTVSRKHFREGVEVLDMKDMDLHIDFQSDTQYYDCGGMSGCRISPCPEYPNGLRVSRGCQSVINEYLFKIPDDVIDFEVELPSRQLIKGEKIKAKIKIINNWMDAVGKLTVEINIPYKVFGVQRETSNEVTKFVEIKKGENIFEYDLPTEQVTDKIYITPTFFLLVPGSKFKGVNYYCFEQGNTRERDVSTCDYLLFGTLYGDKTEIQVNPAPIYLDVIIDCNTEACPSDYTCQQETGLCLRTDIIEKELTCMHLGCPVGYECSSAGLCTETVFVQKECKIDEDCPTNTKCDVGSGLCIEEKIFEIILQCNVANDCPNPCDGKIATCYNNKCIYSGECEKEIINCMKLGCPEGYSCIDEVCISDKDCGFWCRLWNWFKELF